MPIETGEIIYLSALFYLDVIFRINMLIARRLATTIDDKLSKLTSSLILLVSLSRGLVINHLLIILSSKDANKMTIALTLSNRTIAIMNLMTIENSHML